MARFDHYHGLNEWALALINGTLPAREEVIRTWPDGRVEEYTIARIPALVKSEVVGHVHGVYKLFACTLKRYTLADGRVYTEVLQFGKDDPWWGGPHYRMALTDEQGEILPESLWSEDVPPPPDSFYEGLTARARRFISSKTKVHELVRRVWEDGRVEEFERTETPALARSKIRSEILTDDNKRTGHFLHSYTMTDGRVFDEFVQVVRCLGGDHYYLALKEKLGAGRKKRVRKTSLWQNSALVGS